MRNYFEILPLAMEMSFKGFSVLARDHFVQQSKTTFSDSARPKSVPDILSKWQLLLPDILKFSWTNYKSYKITLLWIQQ